MTKNSKIRVLIGNGQPIFRSGLHYLLSRKPGISVIGEAEDSKQALKLVNEQKPTILILDSLMLASESRDSWEEVREKHKNLKIIMLTASEKPDDIGQAFSLNPTAIVSKQAPLDVLVSCIQKLESGEGWTNIPTRIDATSKSPKAPQPGGPANHSPLSVRERQVVGLVSQGYRNKEIAARMFISEQTVKNHLHNIFDKLGVSDRLELALFAIHENTAPQ